MPETSDLFLWIDFDTGFVAAVRDEAAVLGWIATFIQRKHGFGHFAAFFMSYRFLVAITWKI
jgi:hypothetical protein